MKALWTICLLFAGAAYGQDTTGTVSGVVINNEELPLKGVEVSVLLGEEIKAFTITDAQGKFTTPKVDTGLYVVAINYRAHKRSVITKVPVKAGDNSDMRLKLFAQSAPWDTTSVYYSYNIVAVEPKPAKKSTVPPAKKGKTVPKKVPSKVERL